MSFVPDVNECLKTKPGEKSVCPEHTVCRNTQGSYNCVCRKHYTKTNETYKPKPKRVRKIKGKKHLMFGMKKPTQTSTGKLKPKGKMESKPKDRMAIRKFLLKMKKQKQMGKGKMKPKGKIENKPKGKMAKGKIKAKPKEKKAKHVPKRPGRALADGEEPIVVVKRASINNIIAGTAKEKWNLYFA